MSVASSIRVFDPGLAQGSPPLITGQPTVAQVIDWYEADPSREINSADAERERRRNWRLFRAAFGGRLVSDMRPFDLKQFINGQPDVASNWTRKRWNATLQRPFNAAAQVRLITYNPFVGLRYQEGEEGRDWTDAEYHALLRAAPAIFRRLIVLIRFSGLRPGEARALQWPNIRPETGAIVLTEHKTRHKTKHNRCIPLNHVLAKLFSWLRRYNPPAAKHVLLNSYGKAWSRKATTKRLQTLRRKIGLPDDVKLHGGRHTFGTGAIVNGLSIATLMEIMGHRHLATTQRYVHLTNKVDHLTDSMEQAIKSRPKAKAEPPPAKPLQPPAPLFDGLE